MLDLVTLVGLAVMITGTILATISMVLRYRRSNSVERAQLRWIAAAVVVLAAGGIPFVIARYALPIDYSGGPAPADHCARRRLLPADRGRGGRSSPPSVRHRPDPQAEPSSTSR
jgi:hypothetical protein